LLHTKRFVADRDLRERRVLNIGCGFGWFELLALSKGVDSIVGIESSHYGLEVAKQHISDQRVSLGVGSANALPFAAGTFDTVVCWEVLEHIPKGSEPRCFAEVRRVLKEGGAFYLSTPYASLVASALDPAWWLIAHRHYALDSIRAFARQSNLRVEVLRVVGGWWDLISLWNLYVSKWILRRSPLLQARLNRKLDMEYERNNGFTTIFTKMTAL